MKLEHDGIRRRFGFRDGEICRNAIASAASEDDLLPDIFRLFGSGEYSRFQRNRAVIVKETENSPEGFVSDGHA